MAEIDEEWLIFLRLLRESGEATRESGLYHLIIERFPIQFLQKLTSTAVDISIAEGDREHAAAVINELTGTDFVERNYSKIDPQSLATLRRQALELQSSGLQMTLKLLSESLKSGETWDAFLEFAEEGFAQISETAKEDVDRFLALFRRLSRGLQHKLVRILRPRIVRHSAVFEATVVQLLHEAEDETPFLLLACIIRTFDHRVSPAITQAAFTSQFLDDFDGMQPAKALEVAEILTDCVEYTDLITHPFPFSFDDFQIMDGVAGNLAQFLEESAVSINYPEVALLFLETMVTKFQVYYPDANLQQELEEEEEEEEEPSNEPEQEPSDEPEQEEGDEDEDK